MDDATMPVMLLVEGVLGFGAGIDDVLMERRDGASAQGTGWIIGDQTHVVRGDRQLASWGFGEEPLLVPGQVDEWSKVFDRLDPVPYLAFP